jgi:hypothetical protein
VEAKATLKLAEVGPAVPCFGIALKPWWEILLGGALPRLHFPALLESSAGC